MQSSQPHVKQELFIKILLVTKELKTYWPKIKLHCLGTDACQLAELRVTAAGKAEGKAKGASCGEAGWWVGCGTSGLPLMAYKREPKPVMGSSLALAGQACSSCMGWIRGCVGRGGWDSPPWGVGGAAPTPCPQQASAVRRSGLPQALGTSARLSASPSHKLLLASGASRQTWGQGRTGYLLSPSTTSHGTKATGLGMAPSRPGSPG